MNTIYLYRKKDNNKVVYVGITCNVKQRRKQHEKIEPFNNLRNEYNYPLSRAFRKYGVDAFSFEIIEEIEDRDKANIREDYWINYYDTIKNGYNQMRGGTNRTVLSNEDIKEIKKQLKEGKSYKIISQNFNCSESWLSLINNGESYRDENEQYPLCAKKYGKRLNKEQIYDIIELLISKDVKIKDIAKKYNVSDNVIVRINQGQSYKQDNLDYPIRKGRVR